jgi:hypothetical protein
MRSRLLILGFILAILVAGSGCALTPKTASGLAFTNAAVPQDKAVVYFFRSDKFMMSANTIFLSIPMEANNCFAMVTAGYYPYIADPGKLRVLAAARHGNKEFSIDLKPNDVKYVKIDFNSAFVPTAEFTEIPRDIALPEIQKYRLIDACKK